MPSEPLPETPVTADNDLNIDQPQLLEVEPGDNQLQLQSAASSDPTEVEGGGVAEETVVLVDTVNTLTDVGGDVGKMEAKEGDTEGLASVKVEEVGEQGVVMQEMSEARPDDAAVQEVAGVREQEVVVQEVSEARPDEAAVQEVAEVKEQDVVVQEVTVHEDTESVLQPTAPIMLPSVTATAAVVYPNLSESKCTCACMRACFLEPVSLPLHGGL